MLHKITLLKIDVREAKTTTKKKHSPTSDFLSIVDPVVFCLLKMFKGCSLEKGA